MHFLDKYIILSSAIQITDFPSVVGTLWEVDELDGAKVAGEVYAKMLKGLAGLDVQRPAEGLHEAVRRLRNRTKFL